MDYKLILYDVDENGIARITLNDPERMNALSWSMLAELDNALVTAEKDDKVRVIIIKGTGRCFTSGYDLEAKPFAGDEPKGRKAEEWHGSLWNSRAHVQGHADNWFRIWDLWKIVISQVHGVCFAGACELALICDLMTISENCRFGNPVNRFMNVGDVQAFYAWHVGLKRAMDLQMGRILSGKDACEWGFANYCFSEEELEEQTTKIAKRIAIMDPELLMLHKTMVHRTFDMMGFKTSSYLAAEYDSFGHARMAMRQIPDWTKFTEAREKHGLAQALKEIHKPFGGLKPGGLNENPL